MEQVQEKSEFKSAGDLAAISPLAKERPKADFRYGLPEKDDRLQRMTASFYEKLDQITGHRSYEIFNSYEEAIKPYLQLLQFLHDEGLVDSYHLYDERYNDTPFFYALSIAAAYPADITDGKKLELSAYSANRDISTLFSAGIGEFLERYFFTVYKKSTLIKGSPRSLSGRRVRPLDLSIFAGFSEEQKSFNPERRWNEENVFSWEKVKRIKTGEEFLVPAQFVYWNYISDVDAPEPFLREPNTNGCGGMFTKEEAVLSGLYELIQRDAFLIFWLNSLAPPKVNLETVPDDFLRELSEEIKRYGFIAHCLNTTLDTKIPSFIVMLEDPSGIGPRFIAGGGCKPDPIEALTGALKEALFLYQLIRGSAVFELPKDYRPFISPLGQTDRSRLAANPAASENYKFFISGEEKKFSELKFDFPKSFGSKKEELQKAVSSVEGLGKGYEVYAHLHLHPLLKKLGYEAARVIIPQMVPLYLNEPHAPLGSRRLREVSAKMGFSPAKDFNPWPHPFP